MADIDTAGLKDLIAKWREIAAREKARRCWVTAAARRDCADELEAALARQEPVATIHSDGYWTHDGKDPFDRFGPNANASAMKVYATPEQRAVPEVDRRFTELLLGVINDVQDELGFSDDDKECSNGSLEIIAAIRELKEAVPEDVRHVIEALLDLAYQAWNLADNTEDGEHGLTVVREDFDALSAALDALDELPDDQPGFVMEAAAKARWALRGLLAAQPQGEGVDRG